MRSHLHVCNVLKQHLNQILFHAQLIREQLTYDASSPGAIAYMLVARELATRAKAFDSNVVSIHYKREGEIA